MVSRRKRANSSVGNKLNNLTDRVVEQQKLQQVSGTQTNAVTNDSIAPSAVNTESVQDRSITSNKIGRGEVTSENLGVINEIVASGGLDIEAGVDGHLSLSGGKYEDPYDGIEDGDGYKVVAFDPTNNAIKIIDAAPPAESGLRFDTTYTGGSTAPGMLSWNDEDETLEVQVGNGDVTLQIGQEFHVRVHNSSGVTIPNGSVVYMFGGSDAHGHPNVATYIADGTISPFRVLGVATQAITDGSEGLITAKGKIRGLDTSAYTEGQVLYASTSVYGGLQTTMATPPQDIVSVGVVAVSDATDGEIYVTVNPILNQLQTNLSLFPTTTASDVGGYYRLAPSTVDADYDVPAVDVSTGTLDSADNVLVGSLIADANTFVGNPGQTDMTVTGSITKTSGNANTSAGFYFKVFRRTSGGTETLLGTSNTTSNTTLSESAPVGPFEFSTSANVVWETFSNTDRLVLKFYANTVEDGSQSYTFTYGGASPVRALIPILSSNVPAGGYKYVDTVTYTSNGTFSKADYPYLRAIKVKCLGGGGGGGYVSVTTGASQCAVAGGGTGGNYAESFITNISALAGSETVTVGAAGAGGNATTPTSATDGGTSSFGSLVVAEGGNAGANGTSAVSIPYMAAGTSQVNTGTPNAGDTIIYGQATPSRMCMNTTSAAECAGGGNYLYSNITAAPTTTSSTAGTTASSLTKGVGGNGAAKVQNNGTLSNGGSGSAGIVIVELYA